MVEIPRTKDGKHEVIFPQSAFFAGYPLKIRSAIAGRFLYETLDLESNIARRLDERYGGDFLRSYPTYKDPEKLLTKITTPCTGRIPAEKEETLEIDNSFTHTYLVGDRYIEPITPFTNFYSSFDNPLLDRDIFGNLLSKTIPSVDKLTPEYKKFFLDLARAIEIYETIWNEGTLDYVISDKKNRQFAKGLSILAVETTRDQALEMNSILKGVLRNWEYYDDEREGEGPIVASHRLHKLASDVAIALCDEYLSEIAKK